MGTVVGVDVMMYPHRPSMEQIQALRAEGKSLGQLAREFGCGRTTITRWSQADYVPQTQRKRNHIHFYHTLSYLPCLEAKMEAVGATNEALARESGVSCGPINRARQGGLIKVTLAKILYETLNTRKFKRGAQGPRKWSPEMRHKILAAKGVSHAEY